MQSFNFSTRQRDAILLVVVVVLFLLASPFVAWWSAGDRVWYTPYLIWLGIIGLAFWLQRRRRHDL
jgi:hypothetical protein